MNLNDAIEGNCEFDFRNLDVIIELSPKIQKDYDTDKWEFMYWGIGNLNQETKKYRRGKIKVVSRVEDSHELFEIYSEGEPLSDCLIRELNNNYREGSQLTEKPRCQGSRIAAFFLAKVNGRISIENCDSFPYTVKNSVIFE